MSGTGRHRACEQRAGEWLRQLARVVMWPWQLPARRRQAAYQGGAAVLGLDRQVIAGRLARLESCEERLAAAEARLEEFNAAWAAMGPLGAACEDGHRHGLHVVRRELPG